MLDEKQGKMTSTNRTLPERV